MKKDPLQQIPGVGPRIAEDLRSIGVSSLRDLTYNDPEKLYEKLIDHVGYHVDRCVLYVFRCAVYFATTSKPEPKKLKWWYWKD